MFKPLGNTLYVIEFYEEDNEKWYPHSEDDIILVYTNKREANDERIRVVRASYSKLKSRVVPFSRLGSK